MEQDIKQQTVVYNKGITNVPSELLSTDGELVSCEGMTFESGELKPIQKAAAASVGSIGGELMCVHDDRYIYKDGQTLMYKRGNVTGTVTSYSGMLRDVKTVGNTVIASTSEGVYYALWTGSNYNPLGNKIPEPEVTFKLDRRLFSMKANPSNDLVQGQTMEIVDQEGWNDHVFGMYAKLKKQCFQDKAIFAPFALRYAVELYDGSLIYQSSPILFFPSVTENHYVYFNPAVSTQSRAGFTMYLRGSRLYYMGDTSSMYEGWADIVKGVNVYITQPKDLYDTSMDAIVARQLNEFTAFDHIVASTNQGGGGSGGGRRARRFDSSDCNVYSEEKINPATEATNGLYLKVLPKKSGNEAYSELVEDGVFYKLCELPSKTYSSFISLSSFIKTHTLENLTTQVVMEDDYFSHCSMNGKMLPYNGRLHLANVQRGFYDGFDSFICYDNTAQNNYTITVAIYTRNGVKHVSKTITDTYEKIGYYFFYPDPRAKFVKIEWGGTTIIKELFESPTLNGSYTFTNPLETLESDDVAFPAETYSGNYEEMPNQVVVSEVDNPFVFRAKGYNTVGNGSIIGMAAVSMALSEYQHGKQPLVVFSTDGIWSLTVNSEGYYDAIQAVSREVCNNAKSITQVDMGVYFTSAKGLMYLDTSGVTCVSEQMKGTSFEDFIDTCSIAYDYRDSLLHIFVEDSEYHYVYNMKSGTFSTMADTDLYYKAVNNYPDTLIQTGNDNILSLLSKPDEKDDQNVYEGTLVTRAIKFGNLLTLKSIRQMKHLYRVKAWKQGSWTGHQNVKFSVTLTLKASNDGYQWATVHSLRGKPWRYWRFELALGNMSAADRLAGTVVWTQERRMEKIR